MSLNRLEASMSDDEEQDASVPVPKRGRGGAYTNAVRFSGAEDEELKLLAAQTNTTWKSISNALSYAGFAKRTAKSVRNRFIRLRIGAREQACNQKKCCRVCGKPQKGHSCSGKPVL